MPPMRPISSHASSALPCRCPHRPATAARQTHFPSNWSRAADRPRSAHRAKWPAHEYSYGSGTPRASARAKLGQIPSMAARLRRTPSSLTAAWARRNARLLAYLDRNGRRGLARNFRRIFELLQDIADCRVQLRIIAGVYGQRVQGHLHIRGDAFILDAPFPFRCKDAKERHAEKSAVNKRWIGGYPNQPAPGARADKLAEAEPSETVGEKIAAGPCILI